ncbi:MAG: putative OB-fold protein [Rhodothermales bacterium]
MSNFGDQLELRVDRFWMGPYDVNPGATHFWEGVRRNEVLIQKCETCGSFSHPRQESCEHCFSDDLSWAKVSGAGEVYTFSTVHRAPDPSWKVPYSIGCVRLDEDVFLFAEIVPANQVFIGARVAPVFEESSRGTLLKFEIQGTSDAV